MRQPFQPNLDFTAAASAAEDGEALIVDLEGYEGPLHVLLALARSQKVDLLKLSVLKLAEQSIGAGCDVVLHCNGDMAEMKPVVEGCGALKGRASRAMAASARRAARPLSAPQLSATGFISAMSPLQCRTTSQPAAIACSERSAKSPESAFIDRSSLITRPSKPIASRITLRIAFFEVVAGRLRSIAE